MKENPFKFGTVVDGQYFTNRENEIKKIKSYLKSANHIIIISPRRYGKTSLIKKILAESDYKYIYLDLQLVVSEEDFASQLLKRIYRIFPFQKLKNKIKTFRIIPAVILNPVTGETEISFRPGTKDLAPLEDVLNLIENLGNPDKKIKVVLDEFQEIYRINPSLDRMLRSVMQNHKNVNYIFMGSSESMLREIFEKKNSPFYRFGSLFRLGKIPEENFRRFLSERFAGVTEHAPEVADEILGITGAHPHYTQQLAFTVWESISAEGYREDIVEMSVDEIVRSHDNDFERLWNTFNRTDMLILTGMSLSNLSPLSEEFRKQFGTGAMSTVFSAIQRLVKKGIIIKEESQYRIDDPFFQKWIITRRQQS